MISLLSLLLSWLRQRSFVTQWFDLGSNSSSDSPSDLPSDLPSDSSSLTDQLTCRANRPGATLLAQQLPKSIVTVRFDIGKTLQATRPVTCLATLSPSKLPPSNSPRSHILPITRPEFSHWRLDMEINFLGASRTGKREKDITNASYKHGQARKRDTREAVSLKRERQAREKRQRDST
jgi:hypothetical protein